VIKAYHLLAHGRWFSLGTPTSSTTKTDRHDIAEILLKVALKHQKSNQIKSNLYTIFIYDFPIVPTVWYIFCLHFITLKPFLSKNKYQHMFSQKQVYIHLQVY
jgi:hypothetical protein